MMNNFNTEIRHLARMNENFSTSIFHRKVTTGKRINKQCYSIECILELKKYNNNCIRKMLFNVHKVQFSNYPLKTKISNIGGVKK